MGHRVPGRIRRIREARASGCGRGRLRSGEVGHGTAQVSLPLQLTTAEAHVAQQILTLRLQLPLASHEDPLPHVFVWLLLQPALQSAMKAMNIFAN